MVPASRVSAYKTLVPLRPLPLLQLLELPRDSVLPPRKICFLKVKRAKVHLPLRLKSPSSVERGQLSRDLSLDRRDTLLPLLLRSERSLGPGPLRLLRVPCLVRTGPCHLLLLRERACSRRGPGHRLLRHAQYQGLLLQSPALRITPWNYPTSSSEPSLQGSAQLWRNGDLLISRT